MRAAQIRRHLGAINQPKALPVTGTEKGWLGGVNLLLAESICPRPGLQSRSQKPTLNLEFSPRDYVTYLLSIGAGIEHCLMVQYLYAAYSLGEPQVPEAYRDAVRNWQGVTPGISKEEMGHLISVQHSLRLIGASPHMAHEDYPWNGPFYPFTFALAP